MRTATATAACRCAERSGRLLWTSAHLGLGGGLDVATRFPQNLAGLLVALAVLAGSGLALRRPALARW